MKKKYLSVLIIVMLINACQQKDKKPDMYIDSIKSSIQFFDQAYSSDSGVYYSEVDDKGKVLSDKIHTVALSRMIYGLAYMGQYNDEYLQRAQKAAEFQLNNMIGVANFEPYYIPSISKHEADQVQSFDIWQQAYGACGLTELYRQTKDEALLKSILQYNAALIHRFQDKEFGGFYGEYNVEVGQVSGSKTIQSLMYPITALMANLWLADIGNRPKYEKIITEHLEIAHKHVWNDSLQCVNSKYDDQWNPIIEDGNNVSPGHNFQFAALLLRSQNWIFIPESRRRAYLQLAKEIVVATLKKDIWANNKISHGFYEAVNPYTNEITSQYKSWWQHCEAIIALSFLQEDFKEEYQDLVDFYFSTFPDVIDGGEWAKVDGLNQPFVEDKGQKGKSVYHHIEMIRFIQENMNHNQ